jgi:hypothetical protein
MYITNQAQQQVTEPNTASLHQQAASHNQVYELCAAKQGQMASNSGQRREGRGGGGNTLTRRPGACLDGGAVPARPARGYPGMSSPSTLGAPHLGASTDIHTHTPWPPAVAQQAPGEGSGASTGIHTHTHTMATSSRTASTRRGLSEASSRRRSKSAEIEGKPATDLLGEEAPIESSWRRG